MHGPFYRNIFTVTPKTKMKQVTLMLKAIHAQEKAASIRHWSRIRTNNLTERVNREIRRRTRAIGAFPDGSAPDSACCRLRMGLKTLYGHGTSIQDVE